MKKISKNPITAILVVCFAFVLGGPGTVFAASSPSLGEAADYGVVSSTFTNSNTGSQTIINGDVCYSTPPDTPPNDINGATVTPCTAQTETDKNFALADLNGQACTSLGAGAVALDTVDIDGPGVLPAGTFPPGCYSSGGAMTITLGTTVTLSGSGTYIFRPVGALTTGADSLVDLTNGASSCNVFWTPTGATSLGANSAPSLLTPTFVGNIIDDAGITMGHFANLQGRALAFGGTVTTDANTITVVTCGGGVPEFSDYMIMMTIIIAVALMAKKLPKISGTHLTRA